MPPLHIAERMGHKGGILLLLGARDQRQPTRVDQWDETIFAAAQGGCEECVYDYIWLAAPRISTNEQEVIHGRHRFIPRCHGVTRDPSD